MPVARGRQLHRPTVIHRVREGTADQGRIGPPLGARLLFLRNKVAEGFQVHVYWSHSIVSQQRKAKVIVGDTPNVVPAQFRAATLCMLEAIALAVRDSAAVDRGHKHSNGKSEVSMWLKPVQCAMHAAAQLHCNGAFRELKLDGGPGRLASARRERARCGVLRCRANDIWV